MSAPKFVHLRVHTAYSLSEGAIQVPALMHKCKEKNILKKDSKFKNIEQIKPVIDTSKIDKGILELENMIIYLLVQKDLKVYLFHCSLVLILEYLSIWKQHELYHQK